VGEAKVDPEAMHGELVANEKFIEAIKYKHNSFLKERGLSLLHCHELG
jgi:hypothetical protein